MSAAGQDKSRLGRPVGQPGSQDDPETSTGAGRAVPLRASVEQLSHLDRLASIGGLTASLAHEVNSPLGAIVMTARDGRERQVSEDEAQEMFAQVEADARRCARIVRDVLMFARPTDEGGGRIDLHDAVETVRRLLRSRLVEQRAVLRASIPEQLPDLAGRGIDMEQVLLNLVRNSLDAGASEVKIDVQIRSEALRLTVEDDGDGVAREHAEQIFQPFFSTRGPDGGVGLGLSMVKAILSRLGGAISLDQDHEPGARFVLSWPGLSSGQ